MTTMWIVLNADGSYAGVPCKSAEEARELVNAAEGRRCWILNTDDEVTEETNFYL